MHFRMASALTLLSLVISFSANAGATEVFSTEELESLSVSCESIEGLLVKAGERTVFQSDECFDDTGDSHVALISAKINAAKLGNGKISVLSNEANPERAIQPTRISFAPAYLHAYCHADGYADIPPLISTQSKKLTVRMEHPGLKTSAEKLLYVSTHYSWVNFGEDTCPAHAQRLNKLFAKARATNRNVAVSFTDAGFYDFGITKEPAAD